MNLSDLIGYAAAFLTTISFLPQVIKTLKTRDTSSISLLMYSLFLLGVISWFIWGLAKGELSVVLANGVTLILAAIVWVMKITDVIKKKESL